MTVRQLNEKGILLTTFILCIISINLLINLKIDNLSILASIPLLIGLNLIITSNLKIKTKKEPVHSPAKMTN